MATLKEFFDKDFPNTINAEGSLSLQAEDASEVEVLLWYHLDFDSNSKYLSCYIPKFHSPINVCIAILKRLESIFSSIEGIGIETGFEGESRFDSNGLNFSGRIYFYTEEEIPSEQFEKISEQAANRGLSIHYRSRKYAEEKSKILKPLAFISHDSRDKDLIARPIALGLTKLSCPVWFDEYSLKVGDPLRESIESGLKECKKCILVLSKKFFSNNGWTKTEFNSIFTREIIENSNLVLPVWSDVDEKEVYDYSPSLVNIKGINWDIGEEEVVKQLYRSIDS